MIVPVSVLVHTWVWFPSAVMGEVAPFFNPIATIMLPSVAPMIILGLLVEASVTALVEPMGDVWETPFRTIAPTMTVWAVVSAMETTTF